MTTLQKTLFLATTSTLSLLYGGEFQSMGSLSTSMGGVGVASASSAWAGYYNPALLTQKRDLEVSLGVGVAAREDNIGKQINELSNMNLSDTVDRIANNAPTPKSNTQEDRDNIVKSQNILRSIGDKNGFAMMPAAHVSVAYSTMAVGLYMTGEVAITAHIDKEHLGLSVEKDGNYYNYDPKNDIYALKDSATYKKTSLQYALDNNLTTIKAQGLIVAEVPISYAKAFDLSSGELSLGGSVKLMHGVTYRQTLSIDSDDATDSDTLKENKKESNNIGIDVGLLFKPTALRDLQIGLVAKNINAPSFDTVNGHKLKADLQLRTGLQYRIFDSLRVATDLDLTSNATLIPGYKSQMLGAGLEYEPFSWFKLRGGLMQNLANNNDGVVYTAGLAVGPEALQLNLSGQMSSENGNYDGDKIPKYARVTVALTSKW